MKNNKLRKIIALSLAVTTMSTTAFTVFGSDSSVNDFRVMDAYTGLTYGSANNDVLQYTGSDSGVVLTDTGVSINTTESFTVESREDILDGIAEQTAGKTAEFYMNVNVTSCDGLVISANDGTTVAELYNSVPAIGENSFSVKYTDNTATLLLNGETVKSQTLVSLPQIIISGSNAVMEINDVRYGEEVIPETEAETGIRESINAATDAVSMATALNAYLENEGKADIYASLPECDKTEINTRMLDEIPFDKYTELQNGYQKVLEYTTQVDLENYNSAFTEDFSALDSGWTQTNILSGAIGSGRINGTARSALAITEENSSFMFFGGSLNPKAANYIERDIENPDAIVTMYMKVINNNALSFSATFDGSQGICLKNTGLSVHALAGVTDTGVDFLTGIWNKIVFDGTEAGVVKCYVNGTLAATFSGSITKLGVGTIYNFGSYSVIAVDNITVAEEKTVEEYLAKFNEKDVTEAKLKDMLGKVDVSTELLDVLPDCDKTEIVSRIEEGRPFADVAAFKDAYDKAIEYTTQVDLENYNSAFTEDFSALDSGWTQTNILSGAIGSGRINGTARSALAITEENSSFMFFGGSLNPKAANYIERDIENPDAIVTMYMKVINNNALSFSATFDGSQGICLKNTGLSVHALSGVTDTGVDFLTGIWNKIVFDGTETGVVNCYVNGTLAATFSGSITKLGVGTIYNFGSYSVIAVDNITVAEEKTVEEYLAKFNGKDVTEENLKDMLDRAGVSTELFNVLPDCDKTEIVSRMEEGRPFADIEAFKTAYDKALAYTTQTDADKYVNVWTEDFSEGLDETKWTVVGTLRNNAIGDGVMIGGNDLPRKSLNISGNEKASAGFVGANFASGINYITREVANKNSIVSLYFYDTMWDTKGYFSTFIDEASNYGLGISGDAQYYTKRIGGAWSRTNIERSVGWHKIVFDGLTQPGIVTAYFDGTEVFQCETVIGKLTTGNTFADASYYCAWVDNITVSAEEIVLAEEEVNVYCENEIITDNKLPEADSVTVKISNPEYKADYIAATYKDGMFVDAYILTKNEQKNGVLEMNVSVTGATEMKVFAWESVETLIPVDDSICLSK